LTRKRPTFDCLSRLLRAAVRIQASAILLFCIAGWAQATTTDIHKISVDLPASPYLGQTVTTTGIVVAVLSDGFYIENPSSDFDQNTCSSEGIYVYTGTGNVPTNAVLGYSLTVTGLVESSNSSNYAGVQIYVADPATYITTNSTGNSLPSAISSSVMTAATSGTCPDYPSGTFGQWLPFEGMRVSVPTSSYLLVTQGTGGTVTPTTSTATTDGRFWAVFSSTNSTSSRPVRATGISELDSDPSTAPSTVQRWSGNPQLLLVDTTTLGGTALNASATTVYSGTSSMVGIVDYHVSTEGYTGLLLTSSSVSALSQQGGATPTAATTRGSNEITLAAQNLESAPGVGLTATETNRITKLANAIVNYHKSPDILAVQNATSAALADLATAISSAGGPSYTLLAGTTNLSDSMADAFLVNVDTTKFDGTPTAAPALATATYTTTSSTTATLFDRVPLVLTLKIKRKGISDYTLNIVNASLLERTSIDNTTLGPDIRNRREQQAEQLTTQVLEPMETVGSHFMVVGGFDSYEFSDGFVDALGILDGLESSNTSAGTLVTLYDSTYNTTALENTTTTATNLTAAAVNPTTSRYTYVENGSAEQPDHILVSSEMSGLASIDYARIGADFPVSETYDTTTVARASSHDGVIAYFTIPYPTTTTVNSNPNPSYYDEPVTFTAKVVVTGSTVTNIPDGTVTFYDTDGTTELGSAALDSTGVATFTYSSLTVGTHTIHADYGGSETGLGYQASSATTSQEVDKDVASLTLGSSVNPSYLGQPVTFTATASNSNGAGGTGVTPTGTVNFYDNGSTTALGTCTLSSGACTMITSTLTVGTHVITASYGGDTTDSTATATLSPNQVVQTNTTTVTVASSKNPSYYGDSVSFTATAVGSYGTPAGTIYFNDVTATTVSLGTGTLTAGTATNTSSTTYTNNTLSVGTHLIQASYNGDGIHDASTSNTITQVIQPVYTPVSVLSCSPNPAEVQTTVICTDTLTATVGVPTGTITFYDGTTSLGSTTLTASTTSSSAALSTSALSIGVHSLTAVYTRNGAYLASTSNTVTEIIISSFTLSASPTAGTVYTGEAVDSTITVSPGVDFTLDVALTCSGLPANTTCTLTPSTVTGGSGTSKLVVQTTAPQQESASNPISGRGWPLLSGVLLLLAPKRLRRRGRLLAGILLNAALAAGALNGCGGSSSLTGGTPAGVYPVTVTGAATFGTLVVTETTTVTVTVKSMF